MLKDIPKWFWVTLAVIVILTVVSIQVYNSEKIKQASGENINSSVGSPTVSTASATASRDNIFDVISGMQSIMSR